MSEQHAFDRVWLQDYSWSPKKINADDIEYLRATPLRAALAEIMRLAGEVNLDQADPVLAKLVEACELAAWELDR